jgi:hypothetical protein
MSRPDGGPSLYGALGGLDELALKGPLFWPEVPAAEAAAEREELRAWVNRLVTRYDLDSHVVPGSWYRHNHLVEALVALRDYERGSFSATAPATAAVEWHRAFRDIESRLRAWTAELRCDNGHHTAHDTVRVMPEDDWEAWITTERSTRPPVVDEPLRGV